MFGTRLKATCPYCEQEYVEDLGCATKYYKINGSKQQYTKRKCYLCGIEYWLTHNEKYSESRKTNEDDELEWVSTVCW